MLKTTLRHIPRYFRGKTVYRNPHAHLKAYYARGKSFSHQERIFECLHEKSSIHMLQGGGTFLERFNIRSLSEYEKAMYAFLKLIVMKIIHLSYVEDPVICKISKYDVSISARQRNTWS